MKQNHTFYDDLNVARNAPPEVIRAAYKTLAQKYHPDRNSGDSEASKIMALLNAAFATLSDPEKRREYDKWIAEAEDKQFAQQKPQQPQQTAPYSRNDSYKYEQRLNHHYEKQPNQHRSKRRGEYLSLLLWCVIGSIAGGIIGYFFRDYAFSAPIIGAALGLSIPIGSAMENFNTATKNDKKSGGWFLLPLAGVLFIAYNNKEDIGRLVHSQQTTPHAASLQDKQPSAPQAVVSSSAAAEWVSVTGDNNFTAYFDSATIRKTGNMVKMWVMFDFKKTARDEKNNPYISLVAQMEYNCNEEQTRQLYMTQFSGNMTKGEVVYSGRGSENWEPVSPHSMNETFWKIACGK